METLATSLLANIWAARLFIINFIVATVISIYAHATLIQYFEIMLGAFLFAGIFLLGFVGIAAHIRYYFHFERRRKVELHLDRMVIIVHDQVAEQIRREDIINITLYDGNRKANESTAFATLLTDYYYLVVTSKNQEGLVQRAVLTCLLDIRLKKKITAWYGQELKHKFQFFPFPYV